MTTKKARRILGQLGKNLTNDQIKKEIDLAVFLSELIIENNLPNFATESSGGNVE